jgi:hypothetical protein
MEKKHTNEASRSGTAGESSRHGDQDQLRNAQDAGPPTPSDLLPALDVFACSHKEQRRQ